MALIGQPTWSKEFTIVKNSTLKVQLNPLSIQVVFGHILDILWGILDKKCEMLKKLCISYNLESLV